MFRGNASVESRRFKRARDDLVKNLKWSPQHFQLSFFVCEHEIVFDANVFLPNRKMQTEVADKIYVQAKFVCKILITARHLPLIVFRCLLLKTDTNFKRSIKIYSR